MGYRGFIFVGFLMVVFGFIVPFLMVIKVMESSFFWSFLSYTVSVGGLFMGLIGASQYVHLYRKPKDHRDDFYNFE